MSTLLALEHLRGLTVGAYDEIVLVDASRERTVYRHVRRQAQSHAVEQVRRLPPGRRLRISTFDAYHPLVLAYVKAELDPLDQACGWLI